MNAFTILRRALWSIILAVCIVVTTLYLVISNTFLTTARLEQIAKQADIAQTVRNEVILPKIIAAAKESQYATLLDEGTITRVFNQAVPKDALEEKTSPVVDSLQKWLNSKEPTISFSIDTSDLGARFSDQLAKAATDKIASLPRCTVNNSLADAENLVCRSGFVSQATIAQTVTTAIKNNPALVSGTITPTDIPLPSAVQRIGSDLPAYMNMLYAASIITAGVAVMITLWLLLKHRISGLITIGAGVVIAAGMLFVISMVITQSIESFSASALSAQLAEIAGTVFKNELRKAALLLLLAGGVLIVLMSLVKIILLRRAHSDHESMHFSEHKK